MKSQYLIVIITVIIYLGNSVFGWTWYPDYERGKRLQDRWNRYKALSEDQKRDKSSVEGVCGRVVDNIKCTKIVGRPKDEVRNCDRLCCSLGYLTGNCWSGITGVQIGIKVEGDGNVNLPIPLPKLGANCKCLNDWKDATCGPDGRFLGISCPFDRSACARRCCRNGESGGRCGGFFQFRV